MSQDTATKTDKAQDRLIGRIAVAIERIGDARIGLGKLFREAVASGLSKTALIERVTEMLPRNPALYLGEKLTVRAVNGLIAEADAIDRNPDGFIHGNNVVRPEEVGELGLTPSRQAALVTAIDNGLNDKPGVSVAAVASAVRSVRKHGKTSEAGQKAIEKVMEQLAHAERYADAEPGSLADLERILREAERRHEAAKKAVSRTAKAVAEAKSNLAAAKRAESVALAEGEEPKAKPAKKVAKPRVRKAQPLQASA